MQLTTAFTVLILTVAIGRDALGQAAIERAESEQLCMQIANARGLGGALAGSFSSAGRAIESVWKLGDVIRGRAIEDALGGNNFNGNKIPVNMSQYITINGTKVSAVNGENFGTIDKWDGRTVTSIKSRDLNAPTYKKLSVLEETAKADVDKVRNFKGEYHKQGGFHVPAQGQKRALIIAVPACVKDAAVREAQRRVLDRVIAYGKDKSQGLVVDVIVKFFM